MPTDLTKPYCPGCGANYANPEKKYCPCPAGRKLYGRRKGVIRKAWRLYHELGYAGALSFVRGKAQYMGGWWYAVANEINQIHGDLDPEGKIKGPPTFPKPETSDSIKDRPYGE